MAAPTVLEIALPTPLRRRFDYLPPEGVDTTLLKPGQRVRVPFGNQRLIGLILRVKSESSLPLQNLRPAEALLDTKPLLPDDLWRLCLWAADYYQHPIGDALHTALPVLLRQGEPDREKGEPYWQLTTEGKGLPEGALKRAPRQAELLAALQQRGALNRADLAALGIARSHVKTLEDKGLVFSREQVLTPSPEPNILRDTPLTLSDEQAAALAQIPEDGFHISLLDGTTGSGKTEIYLQAIARTLSQGRQALVLVPEIGLTPQTLARFQRRFAQPVVALHSGMNDRERLDAWLQARDGRARIVIGTRSAIFTPMADLGILIVDEEHDSSFKQQDGFRYSARDLAALRAHRLNIPLILGSATPSLESLHNARTGRYHYLRLTHRAGNARAPELLTQDIRRQPLDEGFSRDTLERIRTTLDAGNQVLVFLNRRGYAPTLECPDCGWLAECRHCDTRLTLHQTPRHLHCHHCDHQRAVPRACPSCKSTRLQPLGQGTERSEEALQRHFPDTRVLRVDRDSTRQKNAFRDLVEEVHRGDPCILVGTQMLAKGHHFADVTLVVILDSDAGLFSTDFRGPERMGQLLLQVAGRAGRADKPGQVIIQTHHAEHPLVRTLLERGYHAFAELILSERRLTGLPPFRHMALIRAESKRPENAVAFLKQVRALAEQRHPPGHELGYLGPLPAMLEKRGDRFRYQLQVNAANRGALQKLLSQLAPEMEQHALAKRNRWSIDVDPQDMG
ncbi:replication restart DNA helicase PriA [Marinimicrobium koreense]|uniref:Replication restart protein PriA n=1 Tax=Marinimicrobium koreense TaxID=306545 RepID=A0A3N1NRA9_9GAMM|nr:primosomal protein N' [Marinimicrobium koreense]ROQ21362.1 replication restart DNA helicase PriA [Marinimicrobium koreense]